MSKQPELPEIPNWHPESGSLAPIPGIELHPRTLEELKRIDQLSRVKRILGKIGTACVNFFNEPSAIWYAPPIIHPEDNKPD